MTFAFTNWISLLLIPHLASKFLDQLLQPL